MTTFLQFMHNRQSQINAGYFDPTRLPPEDVMRAAARKAAQRERSDPFIYNRAITAMKKGIHKPTDFNGAISV